MDRIAVARQDIASAVALCARTGLAFNAFQGADPETVVRARRAHARDRATVVACDEWLADNA